VAERRSNSLRTRLAGATAASLIAQVASLAIQLAIPRVLLARWNDGGYAIYIAVTGIAAYLGFADAGVQIYMTQRLSVLCGAGSFVEAGRVARGALRALILLALVGSAILGLAVVTLGMAAIQPVVRASGTGRRVIVIVALALVASAAVALASCGWSSAVEQSHGKYARTPLMGFGRTIITNGFLLSCASLRVAAPTTLVMLACLTVPLDLARAALAWRLLAPGPQAEAVTRVIVGARGGLVMMIASSTQSGLVPATAAAIAPLQVGVVIPSRTVANGARMLTGIAQNILWAPLASRFASYGTAASSFRFWVRYSPVLALIQLGGVAALASAASVVTHVWLPSKAPGIDRVLPLLCAEQALLVAIAPTQVLLPALGHLLGSGAIQLGQALVFLVLTVLLMPSMGALGFASASAIATATCLVPGLLLAEYRYWTSVGVRPARMLMTRSMGAFGGILCALSMTQSRAASIAVSSAVLVAVGAHAWHSVRRGTQDDGTTKYAGLPS